MGTINFVPNDYIEQRQSSRANLLYLMLLMAMLGAIGVTFGFIKMRQRSVQADLTELSARMSKAHEQIAQLEELKAKSKTMMKTMVMTAELLEPIPRSVVLASLTNDLPSGVSLIELNLNTKETKTYKPMSQKNGTGSQYNNKSAAANNAQDTEAVINIETTLDMKGIAPSDIQVAGFISRLNDAILFDDVSLVESKEIEIEKIKYREFRLKAVIRSDLALTKEDIDSIREKREQAT